ncbi:MAG TPA: hypothetical protein G4O03_07095 [Dehalococcoidia bacterium]|jgi:hypothetical protein|nr:hypothetical protein [Dehalococcoidia bacterium]
MRAQVTLTPTESKKLIAKAVARMDIVKRALAQGTVVLHPSSSTYFIVEEITRDKPKTNTWVCGIVAPKGTCVEMGSAIGSHSIVSKVTQESATTNPKAFRHSWVIRGGEMTTGIPLGSLLEDLGPEDVYIKGVNALDTEGNVGVLIGNPIEGGTIGQVMAASRGKGFNVIFPVGLEKLIPIPVKEAAKEALRTSYEYAMGIGCALFPCQGITVTEPKAIEILSGATAIPISAGGLGGAEGSVTLVIRGDEEQVRKAIDYAEQSKGARLPQVRTFNCHQCDVSFCYFPVGDKPWA